MQIETSDRPERGSRTAAVALASSLMAIPRKYPVGCAVAWTALLLTLILAPRDVMPDEDSMSMSIKKYIPYPDLLIHWTLFAGFVACWIRAVRAPMRWVTIPVVGLLLAVGTELAQDLPFIHRDPDILDVMADSFGVAAGLVGSAFFSRPAVGTTDQPD